MEKSTDKDHSDIFNFELKLREKLAQLQSIEEALEQSRAKLTESENLSCKLQTLLESERRNLNQVRSELKTAMELIVQFEDEKIHNQTERARLEINWRNAQINEDNLMKQTRDARMQNVLLQRKNEMLEANLSEQKMLNQVITESVKELSNQMNQLFPTVQNNVEKLKEEQRRIYSSIQAFAEFNRERRNSTKMVSNVLEFPKSSGNRD